uniref:Uncharacterized protein n=1 Tax=Zea mays TaxID=4577 RepID=A0A804PQT7_MAIZE
MGPIHLHLLHGSRSAAAMVAPGSVRTHVQLQQAGDAALCVILVGEPGTPRLHTLQHCSDIVADAVVLSTETGTALLYFVVLAGHHSQHSRFAADGVRDLGVVKPSCIQGGKGITNLRPNLQNHM